MFRLKKRYFILAIILFLLVCLYFLLCKKTPDPAESLRGQWKVVELVDICRTGTTYWAEETYLGRSIEISDKKVEKSIDYWPNNLYKQNDGYEFCRNEEISVERFFAKAELLNLRGWYDIHKNEMVDYISFYKNEYDFEKNYPFEEYVILQDGSILVNFYEGWYQIEPYVQSCTDIKIEDLFGEWLVKRLVSYEDGWIGERSLLEFNRGQIELIPELRNWEEAEGIDFQVKEYYGDVLQIEQKKICLQSESRVKDEHAIMQFETYTCNTKNYQYVKGIHDELGIISDKIQVITGHFLKKNEQSLLDGDIVVIDKKSIIAKIDRGWYLLEKMEVE